MTGSLKKRLIMSAILVAITLYVIFAGPMWLFIAVVEFYAVVGLYEYLQLAKKKDIEVNIRLGLFFGALVPLAMVSSLDPFILAMACLVLFVSCFKKSLNPGSLGHTAMTFFGIVYVTWFFSHLIKIREMEHGAAWVFYVLLISKGGDAGAYFTGMRYGKKKLMEHISPNKSVEGAIGGLITSVLLSLLAKFYIPGVSFADLFFLGIIVGGLAQLGDLAESLIKRDTGVKDSGNLPGLGGVLDILDSLLFSIPFVYFYLVLTGF